MKPVLLSDFHYNLPEDKIAQSPLENRDESKLLFYQNGQISHKIFKEIPDLLPSESLLVFNDTKVIPARIYFEKESGAIIELFLLNPEQPSRIMPIIMQETTTCIWKCMIGNKKRWKTDLEKTIFINNQEIILTAHLLDATENLVQLSWTGNLAFVNVLEALGELPLPPYIRRKAVLDDQNRYQTVYSNQNGAVAAPTAGLHFTENVLQALTLKGIEQAFLTLHVSAGTFQPVKVENVLEHTMHQEQIVVTAATLQQLKQNMAFSDKKVIAVGTTSLRTLESLYWLGVKLKYWEFPIEEFDWKIEKLYPYSHFSEMKTLPTVLESVEILLETLTQLRLDQLIATTEIFIFPSYEFQVCQGLITNFHLPETTLMLLIAAFIGENWRQVYESALANEYRFLSYGDSSLLLRGNMK
jgi:S-adenosylmethionine:tRNA ribosyltransferase-isomerase